MDQRRLPKLLVECANSNMPIEVRHIRFRKGPGGAIDFSAAAPGSMLGAPSRIGSSGKVAGSEKGDAGRFDIPVEIYGVIYIYNPPDRDKLGTGTASVEKPGEAPAAEAPVVAPPVPAQPAVPPVEPAKR
jgi:hypothetical protein